MNRFDGLKQWAWSVFVVSTLAFALVGCEGSDGATGAQGPAGADGADGQDGADGAGVGITPLESCGVCHSEGSFASAPAAHEVFDVGSFADFAVTPDVADLLVSFSVTVDGAPATGATFRRAYFSDGTARTSLTDEIELDPTLFVNNGDGTYSVRIVDGVARFGGTNGRYLVVLLTGANDLEIAAVCMALTRRPEIELSCKEALQHWLDPDNPPTADDLMSLRSRVRRSGKAASLR